MKLATERLLAELRDCRLPQDAQKVADLRRRIVESEQSHEPIAAELTGNVPAPEELLKTMKRST